RAYRALEIGDEPEQVLPRHGVERLAPAAPERHRLEEHLAVRAPVRLRVAVDERPLIPAALPRERGIVHEALHDVGPLVLWRGGAMMGAPSEEEHEQRGKQGAHPGAEVYTGACAPRKAHESPFWSGTRLPW